MKRTKLRIPIGVAAGFANGLFGAGGGTLLVPALEKYMKLETHKAHATALAVILPLSVLSACIYLRGAPVDWVSVLYVSAGGAAGGFVGARLLKKMASRWLNILFGVLIAVAALRMIL